MNQTWLPTNSIKNSVQSMGGERNITVPYGNGEGKIARKLSSSRNHHNHLVEKKPKPPSIHRVDAFFMEMEKEIDGID